MNDELKQKIHAYMKELLVACGWPERVNNDQIISMLPNLWKKLEGEGLLTTLVARGFDFRQFVDIALQARAKADALAHMESFFRKRGLHG